MQRLDEVTARRWAKTLYQRLTRDPSYVPASDEVQGIIAAHDSQGWGEAQLSNIAEAMMGYTQPAVQFRTRMATAGKHRKKPTVVAPLRKTQPAAPIPLRPYNDPPPDTVATLPPKTKHQDQVTKAGLDAARKSLAAALERARTRHEPETEPGVSLRGPRPRS